MLWNSDGGTVRWNSIGGTVRGEQRNSDGETGMVEQCCGTVEECWWKSRTVMVE